MYLNRSHCRILLRCFVTLVAIFIASAVWAQGKRVALVIGNSDYQHVTPLDNPVNDTKDIAAALIRIGFDVTLAQNLDYRSMRLALRDFADSSADADVVLVYFAGHGVEIDNVNYLIPTNAELRSDRDVDLEALRLDSIIKSISNGPGLKIVLVDACRNNPFLSSMTRTLATRSLGRGLGRIDPGGVLVGYAARGGTLALDGNGRNSPYAQALLQHLEEPGLEIGKMFRKVRDTVYKITDGYQEPFTYGSLPGEDIFLVPTVYPVGSTQKPTKPASDAGQQRITNADKLLREALDLKDEKVQEGALTMLSLLYPGTVSGRTAKYKAEQLRRDNQKPAMRPVRPEGSEDTVLVRPGTYTDGPQKISNSSVEAALSLDLDDFKQMQRALNTLGFSVGAVDGIFGPRSRAGLRNFQTRRGDTRTGYFTAETIAALRSIDDSQNGAIEAPLAALNNFDGYYQIEISRRPNSNHQNPVEESKLVLRLLYRKSSAGFDLLDTEVFAYGGATNLKNLRAAFSKTGKLSIRGSTNYLVEDSNVVPFSISQQLPNPMPTGETYVSSHGQFGQNYNVDVEITRR